LRLLTREQQMTWQVRHLRLQGLCILQRHLVLRLKALLEVLQLPYRAKDTSSLHHCC
jgi:hypothetical protein